MSNALKLDPAGAIDDATGDFEMEAETDATAVLVDDAAGDFDAEAPDDLVTEIVGVFEAVTEALAGGGGGGGGGAVVE